MWAMKLNPKVKTKFQDYGTNILLIMEGKKQDVIEQHYSFINRGGVDHSAKIDFPIDGDGHSIATLWSTPQKMKQYFRERRFGIVGANPTETKKINVIADEECQRFFAENRDKGRMKFGGVAETYSTGQTKAEKPDESGSEKWVSRGLKG